ncbi:MAG: PHP-associated domain-containing protein [Candidatus Hermodarchaeota archaeon]
MNLKIDMHIHTMYSGDSAIKPSEAIRYAKKIGLDGIAICDHGTFKVHKVLQKRYHDKQVIIIPAMEIVTHIGEVIALFIDKEIDIQDKDFFTIVDKIKDNNGLIIIPHPFDFLRKTHIKVNLLNKRVIEQYIDGIEIMNSRIIFKNCIKQAQDFNKKYNLFEVGGSDAHFVKEIGNGYTIVRDCDKTEESIKESLIKNKSVSKGRLSSPLVHLKTKLFKLRKLI